MAVEKFLSTQGAILLAGAMIAGAVFFGLRGRGAPPPVAPAGTAPAAAASPGDDRPAPPPRPAASPAGPDRAAVLAAATRDLDRHRAEVVKKCVEPALAKQPEPPRIKLTFNVTFDAEGRQIARGVVEDRETSRYGVSMCAMDAIPALEVPPPGAVVAVELPWTLP